MNKYLYLIIACLIVCLFFTCNNNQFNCSGITTKTDTVITTKSYTVFAKDTIIQFKYKTVNKPTIVYLDTNQDIMSSFLCDSIRVYNQTFEDSNLTVFTIDTVKGKLLGQNTKYTLKVPLRIIDSIFTTITNNIEPKRKPKLLVGVGTSEGFQNLNIAPLVGVQAPNGRLAIYEYNTWSKTHNIKLLVPISFPKK